ncbi:Lysophospholipase 2 [Fusarium oxysporum f. sp. albedinis]|nr:Lysophospholipase 2 [Fusarium oxysporum f. sp. albedinis]
MRTRIVFPSYYVTKCHLSSDPSALNARLALRPFISAIHTRSWYLVEMEKSNCSGECKTEQNLYAGCRQSAGTDFIDHIHTHAYMRSETPFVLLHVMPV